MSPQIVVAPTEESIRPLARMLRENQALAPLVISRALNKTLTWVRTRVVRGIADEIAVKQKDIRANVALERATRAKLMAKLHITGRRIPIVKFGARQMRKGVSYRLSKRKGRTTVPGAFVATMKSGHKGAFVRQKATKASLLSQAVGVMTGGVRLRTVRRLRKAAAAGLDRVPRLPIQELMGPSLPGVAQHAPGLLARTIQEAGDRTRMEIARQVGLMIAM